MTGTNAFRHAAILPLLDRYGPSVYIAPPSTALARHNEIPDDCWVVRAASQISACRCRARRVAMPITLSAIACGSWYAATSAIALTRSPFAMSAATSAPRCSRVEGGISRVEETPPPPRLHPGRGSPTLGISS